MTDQPITRIAFGDVVLDQSHFEAAEFRTAINERDTATFRIKLSAVEVGPIDYFSPVEIRMSWQGNTDVAFSGNVVRAEPGEEFIDVQCESALQMIETLAPTVVSAGVSPQELVHLMARLSGFPESRINIQGFDQLHDSTFDVITPVTGVVVEDPLQVGPIRLLPSQAGGVALGIADESEISIDFRNSECFACATVIGKTPFEAEGLGVAEIDVAMAWIGARTHYGHFRLPDGMLNAFQRSRGRTQPRRAPVVFVGNSDGDKRWLRETATVSSSSHSLLTASSAELRPPMPANLTTREREALVSGIRAMPHGDPIQRVQALWEAVEFLVERPPKLFSREEIRELREAMTSSFQGEKRDRIERLLASLNDAPLMAKLRHTVQRDGIDITEGEWSTLSRLRKARSDAVHGDLPDRIDDSEIERGVSIMSRVILHRLAQPGDDSLDSR